MQRHDLTNLCVITFIPGGEAGIDMATSHILSAVEPVGPGAGVGGAGSGGARGARGDREVAITLDDRDLWVRFQTLINEMIVTKNGR